MPETLFRRRLKFILPALCIAVVGSFALAAWSLAASHQQACASRSTTLNVIRDVVVLATKPRTGQKLTAERRREVVQFRNSVFARIAKARC
jgi:hypothetical protein